MRKAKFKSLIMNVDLPTYQQVIVGLYVLKTENFLFTKQHFIIIIILWHTQQFKFQR